MQTVCWLLPIWKNEIDYCEIIGKLDLKKYYKRLRKLPNVKAIEFPNANNQYQCFEKASIYALLRPAMLQVQIVLCEGTVMLLAYSSRGNLTDVTLGQSSRKPSVMIENTKEDVWQAADVNMEGCDSDDDIDSTSTCSKSTELIDWVLFSRFITLDHLTLKDVKLYSLTILTPDLNDLTSCPFLTCLILTNIDIIEDVTALLQVIKNRKESTKLPALEVTLEQIRQDRCPGEISRSDTEITARTRGHCDDFLEVVRKTFEQKTSEQESDWQDEDESDDENLMWNDGSDMFDAMGDFEYHYGSDYKDLPGYYMSGGF